VSAFKRLLSSSIEIAIPSCTIDSAELYESVLMAMFIFILFFQRGIKIAKQTTDPFGIMLSIGIVLSMVLYTFINVGYVTGVLPVTGLPIPLISHGGSNLVITLSMLGILLNISESKRSVNKKLWNHQ